MDIAIHINPTQPHQKEHAQWLSDGFKKLGYHLTVTTEISKQADIHIVSGPHYAKQYYMGHPRTILLDRAMYHEEKTGKWKSMDWVSLGWMNDRGGRIFWAGTGRRLPHIKDRCAESGTIFLVDYRGTVEPADAVRFHPADRRSSIGLVDELHMYRRAVGYSTTALVTAALEGLEVISKDPDHILNQPDWLEKLAYADWHYSHIQSGEALEHLCHHLL